MNTPTIKTMLDYEIRSSWWAKYIGWGPLQSLAGSYFAFKTKRKYKRWQESLNEKCLTP